MRKQLVVLPSVGRGRHQKFLRFLKLLLQITMRGRCKKHEEEDLNLDQYDDYKDQNYGVYVDYDDFEDVMLILI